MKIDPFARFAHLTGSAAQRARVFTTTRVWRECPAVGAVVRLSLPERQKCR